VGKILKRLILQEIVNHQILRKHWNLFDNDLFIKWDSAAGAVAHIDINPYHIYWAYTASI
jgi:hypothetical protein